MKALTIVLFLAVLLGGCADPLEKGTLQEVPEKFQRGITGNGSLGPMDRSDDPYIQGNHP